MFEGFFGKKEEPIRVDPEKVKEIEESPVSDKLKRQRLAGEMVKEWKEQNPGEEIPEVEVVDDEEKIA